MNVESEPMYTLGCFNCDREGPAAMTSSEAEDLAGTAGWVLGLDPDSENADAEFACAECADLLVDPYPVMSLRGAIA